jgi:hypothetical protein
MEEKEDQKKPKTKVVNESVDRSWFEKEGTKS